MLGGVPATKAVVVVAQLVALGDVPTTKQQDAHFAVVGKAGRPHVNLADGLRISVVDACV